MVHDCSLKLFAVTMCTTYCLKRHFHLVHIIRSTFKTMTLIQCEVIQIDVVDERI